MDFDDGFSSEDNHEVEDLINEIFGSEEADVDLEPEEDSSEVNSMWNATRVGTQGNGFLPHSMEDVVLSICCCKLWFS